MKFKFDENLPFDLGALLRAGGYDAHSVLDENLRGAADLSIAKVPRILNLLQTGTNHAAALDRG